MEFEEKLEEFEHPEKVMALMKHLELGFDTAEITEINLYYTVNQRKVKRGTPPAEYKTTIKLFKTLLSKNDIRQITSFMDIVKMKGDLTCTEKLQDQIYKKINTHLEAKKDSEAYKALAEENLYVCNVLYHLLSPPSEDHIKSYHEAWQGKTIQDRRYDSWESDGEYLVLTDSEADETAREYLGDGAGDDELWKMAVQAGNTTLGLDEWIDHVMNIEGRAAQLSSYDGSEEEEEINATTYYIYRTN